MTGQCTYTEGDARCTKGADHAPAGHVMTGTYNPADPYHTHRRPYVGEGADGARRSAEIDRSEADGFDRDDPWRDERLASAEQWDAQAVDLDITKELVRRRAAQYDNPEPLRSEVPWVPPRTVEASVTINPRQNATASAQLGAAYARLLDQLAIQAGGAHNIDLRSGFEVTITVKAWKHP